MGTTDAESTEIPVFSFASRMLVKEKDLSALGGTPTPEIP
jgi:hypothetical protein